MLSLIVARLEYYTSVTSVASVSSVTSSASVTSATIVELPSPRRQRRGTARRGAGTPPVENLGKN